METPPSPYRLRLDLALPLLGLGLAGSLAVLIPAPPPACLPASCSPDGLNALDRTVVGGYAAWALTWANALMASLCTAPVLLELLKPRLRAASAGLLVIAVAMALTQATTQLTKFAVARPAPFVFTPELTPESALMGMDAGRSFISGHTATAFVAATLLIAGVWLRWPTGRARWAVLLTGGLLAAAVGVLKVVAGYHYWTDIMAGALVGTSIGAAVALAHRRPEAAG